VKALCFGIAIGLYFSNEMKMRNVIQFDGIMFWVDQNIIYCKLNPVFLKNHEKSNVEDIFYNAISILSNGRYLPILISLEEMDSTSSLRTFKIITNSNLIKTLVLSKIFLVRSISSKIMLSLNNVVANKIVPNKIFKDFNSANKYCQNNYMSFNRVS